MKELHELEVSYDQAYLKFQAEVGEAHRQWTGRLLRAYPVHEALTEVGEALRVGLKADAVEVNAISDGVQATVFRAPRISTVVEIPDNESFCVLTVGAGEPLQVRDIQNDEFTERHPARRSGLTSWASVPIIIEGASAGTVCALEAKEPRDWTAHDQQLLQDTANMISGQVTRWAKDRGHLI